MTIYRLHPHKRGSGTLSTYYLRALGTRNFFGKFVVECRQREGHGAREPVSREE
jgi:hypothetical protein